MLLTRIAGQLGRDTALGYAMGARLEYIHDVPSDAKGHNRTSGSERPSRKKGPLASSGRVGCYSIERRTSSVSVYMSKRASLPSEIRQICAKGARSALPVALLTPV